MIFSAISAIPALKKRSTIRVVDAALTAPNGVRI
jgi:hypothetical protein